jgi:cyclopropane fatty-acyl-phospholipid synthase-like methyltransferase
MSEVWSDIYGRRSPAERSWTQQVPVESIRLIEEFGSGPNEAVIDVGGGASAFAISLLVRGYTDVTVLDVAAPALVELERTVTEMHLVPDRLKTVCADILDFTGSRTFATWHDRAVFHFLVTDEQKSRYRDQLNSVVRPGGLAIIATFSPEGPNSCSGLPVRQWSTTALTEFFAPDWGCSTAFTADHTTPGGSVQSFSWVALRRL